MIYTVNITTKFKKDIKQIKKQRKNFNMLYALVVKIAMGEALDKKYKDHLLSGDYSGFRECHIEPDWLLVYQIDDEEIILLLSRTGSHSDLFR